MINVNYDALGNSSKELWEEADELGNHIRRITRIVEELPDVWESESCKQYVEHYWNKKSDVDEYQQFVEEMADSLQEASRKFAALEADMAGRFQI